MSENFVVSIHNGTVELVAPAQFGHDQFHMQTETTIHHPKTTPKTETGGAETGMAIVTGAFLVGAVAIGVLLNNPQTLKKIDQKLDSRRERQLDSHQRSNSLQ